MYLGRIWQRAKQLTKETWHLDDGTYTGKIIEFKQVKNGTHILLKIDVDEN